MKSQTSELRMLKVPKSTIESLIKSRIEKGKELLNPTFVGASYEFPSWHRQNVILLGRLFPNDDLVQGEYAQCPVNIADPSVFSHKKELQDRIGNLENILSMLDMYSEPPLKGGSDENGFVDSTRISELREINKSEFDLDRLIRLCEELNVCYDRECYIAVAALIRTIMNHIPPIFGCSNFSKVANNYGGETSFKKSMLNLEKSAKNISDRHLHEHIDKTVALPNKTQVNFSQDFDVLLEKIVQELK